MDFIIAKTKRSKDIQTFYSSEAYCLSGNLSVPMKDFAPELLNAQTEEDIYNLLKKYSLQHSSISPCAEPVIYRSDKEHPWEFKRSDDFVPSYASWLLEQAKTAAACLQLYTICAPIANGKSGNSDTTDMFEILHYACETHHQILTQVHHNYEWIPHQDIRESRISFDLRNIPSFPLVSLWDDFRSVEGGKLQRTYGRTVDQFAMRGDVPSFEIQYPYWKNPAAEKEIRGLLWGYASNFTSPDAEFILDWKAKDLATRYLAGLDRYIEKKLKFIQIKIDSLQNITRLTTREIDVALYLWVYTQLQILSEYRVCEMCGRLFVVGSQKGRKFCGLHKKHKINYFNKKIRELSEVSRSEEKHHFVVCE